MSPDRSKKIGDDTIEEFYWAGKLVCYVNNRLSKKTFDEEIEERVAVTSDNKTMAALR